MSLKSIKNNIRSIDKTHKVTKAMEAVSAVKMRKSQERALISRPYALSALRILTRIQGNVDARQHPLIASAQEGRVTCILLVTSDKGLAGSLNSSVIKEAALAIQDMPKDSVRFVCIGNKGKEYFERRGYTILKHYDNVSDDIALSEMLDITKEVTTLFLGEDVNRVLVAYTNFVSTFEQKASTRQVLPVNFEELKKVIGEITPQKGRYSEGVSETDVIADEATHIPYTIEPSPKEVFEELLPTLLNIELYHALLESKASEHSARMVAMKNASDKAEDMAKELTLLFNKERQAEITSEISEIVGGMGAMSNN